jgi:hypothetical protein
MKTTMLLILLLLISNFSIAGIVFIVGIVTGGIIVISILAVITFVSGKIDEKK